MLDLKCAEIIICHICSAILQANPLYTNAGVLYCPHHGDFFPQKLRDKELTIIFRSYEENTYRIPTSNFWSLDGTASAILDAKLKTIRKTGVPVPIRCDQTGKEYKSYKEAAMDLGIHEARISMYMGGRKGKSVRGYTFTRIIDSTPPRTESFVPAPRLPHGNSPHRIKVRCEQTGIIFDSMKDAAIQMNISHSRLTGHVKGKYRHVSGYTFKPVMEGEKYDTALKSLAYHKKSTPKIRIKCVEEDIVYESINSTAKIMGIKRWSLMNHLENPTKYPNVDGYTFVKLD